MVKSRTCTTDLKDASYAEAAIEAAMQMLGRALRTEHIRSGRKMGGTFARRSNLLPGVPVASCADANEGIEA